MENTVANKVKFFALYWGQRVIKKEIEGSENFIPEPDGFISGLSVQSRLFLELKSIKDLEYEDALWLAKEVYVEEYILAVPEEEVVASMKKEVNELHFRYNYRADTFRSKGYALPFMGVDVDTLISWGWVKLKK